MGFFASFAYIIISLFTGSFLILVSINYLKSVHIDNFLLFIHSDPKWQWVIGLTGLWIILRCINTIRHSLAKIQREKTIAYQDNLGEVSISLTALEDMIKKLLMDFKEFKEVKPQVTASKKGINVILRAILTSSTNIPEFTGKVQSIVKNKLQTMLGIEEDIQIKIDIRKILFPEQKKPKKEQSAEEGNTAVPYRDFQP